MLKNITCNEFYIKLITNLFVHVMASFFKMSMFDPEFIFMGRHCASLQKTTILPRFFTFTLQIIIRDREKLKKKMENRDEVIMYNFQFFFQIFVYLFLFFCISSVNVFKYIKSYKYQNQNFSFYQLSGRCH